MGKETKVLLSQLSDRGRHLKTCRSDTSLFADANYGIKRSTATTNFDKAYKGILSDEEISLDAEYQKRQTSKEHSQIQNSELTVFNDADCKMKRSSEISEFDQIYQGKEFDSAHISFDKEYCTPPGIFAQAKIVQSENSVKDKERKLEEGFGTEASKDTPSLYSRPALFAPARAISGIEKSTDEDAEKIDRALAIAEDFSKSEGLILVGGAIYRYNGKFYTMLSEDTAQRLVFLKYRKEVSHASTASTIRNVVTLLKYSVREILDEFPVNEKLIIFENGTLEVDTGHFRKNSPDDFANSALGISYDPDRWKMPYTQNFLETIANGDDDLYELMLQVIGYILSNDVRAKSFFYLEGVGDAGKSRFCDLIASFFPVSGSNKVARTALQDLGGKYALGNLVNTKLNISEDLPDNPLSPTTVSRIKMLSDSNRLEAEAKYVQPFSFRPVCKLLFASNHPLRIKEYDAAFINRVVYIPFFHAIPKEKQDKDILAKMQRELPALFNHAFEAYKRLVASGYSWAGADRFKPEICIVNSGISINKELTLKRFVEECCVFEESAITSVAEIQEAYKAFCHENHVLPIQGDRFSRELMAMMPSTVTRTKIGNQKRGFKGVALKQKFKQADLYGLDAFDEI